MKRGEPLSKRRYNYFDDEPEVLEEKEKVFSLSNAKRIKENAKITFEELAHGEVLKDIREIREMPNLQILVLKMTAVVLFIVMVIVFIIVFSHTITSQNNKNHQYYEDAGKVCTDYITRYGSVKWENLDSDTYGEDMARMTGLCYARQMDFDNDGSDELLICYNSKNVYTLEVWGYYRKEFVKLYGEPANSTKDKADGCWIGLYRQNNKYYICKSNQDTPEKVDLYELRGSKFKKDDSCDYDYKNNIYSFDGEINASDFETIKLSVIKTSKAESILNTVTENIDSFSTVSVPAIEMHKSDEQLMADAYFNVAEKRIERYGQGAVEEKDGSKYIDGVGVVRLVDFNNDGTDELLLGYRKQLKQSATNAYNGEFIIVEEPTYCIEVYGWNGAIAQKLFSRDYVSNYLQDADVNYIMLKNDGDMVDICINNYVYETSYTYSATSKIFQLKDNSFEQIYDVKLTDNYGYRNYYIDGEYAYRRDFEKQGYSVPKFMDDGGKAEESVYTLIYLSGEKSDTYEACVNQSVEVLQTLNKNYLPD